jgi:hypothetical protein
LPHIFLIEEICHSENMDIDAKPSDILPKIMPETTLLLSPIIQEDSVLLTKFQDLQFAPYHQGAFPQVNAKALAAAQASVPEPSTLALLCLGLLGLLGIAKKRRLL